ncbi:uncharacterized protein VP01_38g5 [Puccinia sorghi]|uniref:Uncharacterized protein n=1 Tax=Puccinia sorghi TaxID=27349 RepID=A0A0L6USU6_9BASI|nr:uncharacterized protein VP01_38g5 [Puccinia sorghi]
MPNTMSQSVKTADRLVEDSVTETIVEISFESEFLCLLHCSSIAVGWNIFDIEDNFKLLDLSMDRSILHVVKSSIALDVRPILKDADSALEAFQTLKKNFHKSTRAKELEFINDLGVSISPIAQGLFLQALTSPPAGTTCMQMNNLILVAAEKSDELGAREVQVIYNSVQDSVEGVGMEANLFRINWVGYNGCSGGLGRFGNGWSRWWLSSIPSTIMLRNVLYCPNIHGKLVSPGQLLDDGFKVDLSGGLLTIPDEESGNTVTVLKTGTV